MLRLLSVALIALASLAVHAQEQFKEGVHYQLLAAPIPVKEPAKVEVTELFWYGCPHCFEFEPVISAWLKNKPDDVAFRRVPVIFGENWVPHARAFYAAEALGKLEAFHPWLFKALHEEKRRIFSEADLVGLAGEVGIPAEDFKSAYTGFSIDGKVKAAMNYTRDSGITGVPSIVVNGKYRTGAQLAGGQEEVLKVVDFLVAKERAR